MQCCILLFMACNCMATSGTDQPFLSHQMEVVVSLLQFSCLFFDSKSLQSTGFCKTLPQLSQQFISLSMQNNTRDMRQQPGQAYFSCFRFSRRTKKTKRERVKGCLPLSFPLSIWFTGSDQHHVRFWGSNPELPGGKQVNLPGRLCGQSSDVDRVSSVAGGGSCPGSGLASGKHTQALT